MFLFDYVAEAFMSECLYVNLMKLSLVDALSLDAEYYLSPATTDGWRPSVLNFLACRKGKI